MPRPWPRPCWAKSSAIAKATSELFQGAIDGRYDAYDATYPFRRPNDGRVIWVRARATLVRDQAGKPLQMYGVNQDISDMKALQADLETARDFARTANIPLPITSAVSELHRWAVAAGHGDEDNAALMHYYLENA